MLSLSISKKMWLTVGLLAIGTIAWMSVHRWMGSSQSVRLATVEEPTESNAIPEVGQYLHGGDFHSMGLEADWASRANRSEFWPIPAALRLPGGPERVALARSPEEWLLALPASQRPIAEAFLNRNAFAYSFESKAEQAWLIENGFPSLEEAAFFAGLPRAETCKRSIDEIRSSMLSDTPSPRCVHVKLSALSADLVIQEVEAMRQRMAGRSQTVEIDGSLSVSPEALEVSALSREASRLAEHGVGAYRFYQRASLARLSLREDQDSMDPADAETVSLALAFACEGDGRLSRSRNPQLWGRPATATILATMNALDIDLRRADGTPACGFSRRLGFPAE